ncbi:MAG: MFS transporter, partial [SAR202 cluster bacterium]|nr:MFS transporter [SAR202 cluster bacterium]
MTTTPTLPPLPPPRSNRGHYPGVFRAFENPIYRTLWPAGFFFYSTRWMQVTLLGWFVLELTDSALRVALVGFCISAPLFVLGPFGGVMADSRHRQSIVRVTQVFNLVIVVAMTVFMFLTDVPYWYGYLVALAVGIAWAFENPTRRSIMLDLHGRTGVVNAMALESAAMNASRMAGPALAGLLIALVDVRGGYVVVSAFAFIATLTVLLLDLKLPQRAPSKKQSLWSNLGQGLDYIRHEPVILAVIFITIIMNLFLFSYMQIMPVIARDVLHVGPGRLGVLQAFDGLGALAGAFAIAAMAGTIRRHGWVYIGGSLLSFMMLL